MLVLNLVFDRRIRLLLPDGREIWLKNVGLGREKGVKIGIEAPDDVRIEREEIIVRPVMIEQEEAPGTGS